MIRCNLKWKNFKLLVRSFNRAADYFPRFTQKDFPHSQFSKLKNDVRVITENWDSSTCTVGIWMDIGSRCENETNNGIAHFLEHMYFKGTTNKNHKAIQAETIERGATLNSFTTREMTAIYANCHKNDLDWAVSLLSEIVAVPKFDDELIENAKKSILKEMQCVEKNSREVIFDYLHATAFQGTPLGRSVLGSEENILKFSSKELYEFINNFFKAPRMVLAAAGDIDHSNLTNLANKYLGNITCNYENGIDQRLPCRFTGSDIRDRDDALPLGHVTVAFQGPGWAHTDSIPLLIASTIYGSYDRTYGGTIYSANNTAIASFRNGNMHSYENFFISYHDTSLWGFYYTSPGSSMQLISEYVMQRMVRLCSNISEFEVNRAKNQLKTKLMLSFNGSNSVCEELGRQAIVYGRRIPINEMLHRIDLVNAGDVREVSQKYIYDKCPAVAGYGPIEGLPDYNNIRSRTWWLRY